MHRTFNDIARESQPAVISSFRNFNKTRDYWPSYAKELEQHLFANGIRDNSIKRMYLLRWIGSDTLADLQKIFHGRIHEKSFEEIITAPYEAYIGPSNHNSILEARLKFYQTKMKKHQTYPEWVAELRATAEQCFFKCQKVECTQSYVDSKIRDMIVLHTPHDSVRAAALMNSNPSLDDVLQLASVCTSRETNGNSDYLSLEVTTMRPESTPQIESLEIQNSRTMVHQMKTSIVFIVGYAANRDGLYTDVNNIFQTFKQLFNAEFEDWTNLNKLKLRQKFKELARDEWRQRFIKVDFVTVFCLAHGQEEGEVLFGNRMHDVKDLLLTPLFRIKELDKKLKWVIVQACRGKFNDPPHTIQRDVARDYCPDYYIISYCTGEGTISWQPNEPGKIFIKSICNELRKNANNLSLQQILLNVNMLVKQYGERQTFKDIPAPVIATNYPGEFYLHKRANHYVKISM